MSIFRKPSKRTATLLALLAIGIAIAWFVFGRSIVGQKIAVQEVTRTRMIHSVVTTGRVRPLRVRLAPIASGTIRTLPVREGDTVSAGQLLLTLDNDEALAALANANALLSQATAGRRKLRTVTRKEAKEAVAIAKTRLADADRDSRRVQKLQVSGIATSENVEDAKISATLAKSALRSAVTQERDLKSGGATVRGSDAAVQQAEANVALATARLHYTRLIAPADGIVIARNAEVGDVITGNTVVLEIAATATTELIVEPDERNLALLELGQNALASAEAFPEQNFVAQINFIAPVVDSRRGTIEVRLLVPTPPTYLRPDMTVSVDIEVARKEDAVVVPIDSVVELASPTPYVLVVEKKRVVRRNIEVGIRDIRHIEVLSGVTENDQIISQPSTVEVGARVRKTVIQK